MSARLERIGSPGLGNAVDPRAAISPDTVIGPRCAVGPFAVIGEGVTLGEGCVVHPHAVVTGNTTMGRGNEVHSFACIGGPPQDLRHGGEPTDLVVGEGNVFREHVTVNRGTVHGGGKTVIGDFNLFMAYAHIAHDCVVGSHVIMANQATLAGHAVVEDYAVFGGMVGVGTFHRIGESAMLAAGSMVERDAPPFCIVAGDRARLRAVNRVGIKRRAFGPEAVRQIKAIFKMLKAKELSLAEIVGRFEGEEPALTPEAGRMLRFLGTVKRGLTR